MAAPTQVSRAEIRRTAHEGLGFDQLRPGQQQVIEAVLAGRDTLAVMPTGSGKSAIYQIAGALIPGATLVVSPLIALQKDQLDALAQGDVGEAAALNSALPEAAAGRGVGRAWRATPRVHLHGARAVQE